MIKRLLVSVSSDYGQEFKVVPVNTNETVEIESDLGVFSLAIYIKNFDGSKSHLGNSCYNVGEPKYLDGNAVGTDSSSKDKSKSTEVAPLNETEQHNLRLSMDFRPNAHLSGAHLLFGNDFNVPIRDYVPSLLLSTGLKIFTRFINSTLKGDIYCDKPFLYGLVLNSITYLTMMRKPDVSTSSTVDSSPIDTPPNEKLSPADSEVPGSKSDLASEKASPVLVALPSPPANYNGGYGGGDYEENLDQNGDEKIQVPATAGPRKVYFKNIDKCSQFTFRKDAAYRLTFDTISVKMADSKYAISIPTFAGRTFDIDAQKYANEKLDNFNWVVKHMGIEGVGHGTVGLVISFTLIDEEPNPV